MGPNYMGSHLGFFKYKNVSHLWYSTYYRKKKKKLLLIANAGVIEATNERKIKEKNMIFLLVYYILCFNLFFLISKIIFLFQRFNKKENSFFLFFRKCYVIISNFRCMCFFLEKIQFKNYF